MKNLYHSDIYKFNTPVKSYWEETSNEKLNLEKLTKNINCEIVVVGGGYTGLLCAINLIENYNLDVILIEAGKIGWGHHLVMGVFVLFHQLRHPLKNYKKFMEKKKLKNSSEML